ncbi:MAG: diguanylate cyclase [Phycisphaerae bacterium]|nr:diguanylate cyclase [Phycisphaerae bacterium]
MRSEPVDICIIEDDAAERALLFRRMRDGQFRLVEAEDGETGLAQIRRHRPRVVICDLMLPGLNGLDVCRQVRADAALDGTYIIVVTACREREAKNDVLNAGADDYLVKPYDAEELAARLRNGLRINKLQEHLRRAALTDGLTGLSNHTEFRELLKREFARTRRYGGVVSLLMLDLDHFKAVNDTYGHETGNQVLKIVARQLGQLVRDTDVVARYGGEEFAIVCPETNMDEATRLAERMRGTLARNVRLSEHPQLSLTVSIGVSASSDPTVHSVSDLINQADHALYLGKRGGRDQVVRSDTRGEIKLGAEIEIDEVERLQKQVISLSKQAKELCLQSVWAFVQALEARDPHTAWHSRNTTFYAVSLAKAAGMPETLCAVIGNAAMLHDLGKIAVPDEILQSREPLSEQDGAVLRQVPLITCKILEPLRIFEAESVIIHHLRERFDGTGYPYGLVGATIPIGARLLAVAETFDALTSERPHRPSRDIDEAAAVIQSEAGKQFDPEFATLLERVVALQRDRWIIRIQRTRADLRPVLDACLLPPS